MIFNLRFSILFLACILLLAECKKHHRRARTSVKGHHGHAPHRTTPHKKFYLITTLDKDSKHGVSKKGHQGKQGKYGHESAISRGEDYSDDDMVSQEVQDKPMVGKGEISSSGGTNKFAALEEKVSEEVDRIKKLYDDLQVPSLLNHTNPIVEDILQKEEKFVELAEELSKTVVGNDYDATSALARIMSKHEDQCNPNARYRTMDGSCNNKNLTKAATPYVRLTVPNFDPHPDRSFTRNPVGGLHNSTMMNPRKISIALFHEQPIGSRPKEQPARHPVEASAMFLNFAATVSHDLMLTNIINIDCCNQNTLKATESLPLEHQKCFPFHHKNDPIFGHNCTSFTRADVSTISKLEARSHFHPSTASNGASAILDIHVLYGLNDNLREKVDGRLKQNDQIPEVQIPIEANGVPKTGDPRNPMVPMMFAVTALLFTEHNRIAGELKSRLGSLLQGQTSEEQDEILFQEARRITIAEYQHIIYDELLKTHIGEERWKAGQFSTQADSEYNHHVDPGVSFEFNTAYRALHSMVPAVSKILGSSYATRDHIFKNQLMLENGGKGWHNVLAGGAETPCQAQDNVKVDDLTNFLNFGGNDLDLSAIDVQRGRDFGVAFYDKVREQCGLAPLSSWESKPVEIPAHLWNILRTLYATPKQIELYVGLLSESAIPNTYGGPTSLCIVEKQFHSLKIGDRFFFTHTPKDDSRGLGEKIKSSVRTRTCRDLICDNTEISQIQKDVFRIPGFNNPVMPCSHRNHLDFDAIAAEILQELELYQQTIPSTIKPEQQTAPGVAHEQTTIPAVGYVQTTAPAVGYVQATASAVDPEQPTYFDVDDIIFNKNDDVMREDLQTHIDMLNFLTNKYNVILSK